MTKRKDKDTDSFNRGAGPYSQNDVVFARPRNVDPQTGDTRQPRRQTLAEIETVSGDGFSRPVTHGNRVKRYGP